MNSNLIRTFEGKGAEQAIELMAQWTCEGRMVDEVNISTFLHRCAKARTACPLPLLAALVKTVEQLAAVKAREIATILYSLRVFSDCKEAREMLEVLAPKIDQNNEEIGAQVVGNSLYGLQKFNDSPQVRKVLAALARKIGKSDVVLGRQEIGNAIYGLQRIADSTEMRSMMRVLGEKIAADNSCVLS